ncbi:MAG: hypothetical protein DRJ42_10435 [Deltaproteobacteria bacterium]|nr:MAG: hypothetical protein DRJ42_10435 [Deltaproteobacteria bacterium]
MRRQLTLAIAATLAVGCTADAAPPRPQALVIVDTDLPSPELADRVRIEVLALSVDGRSIECDGCSREISIETDADWPISFGVEAPPPGDRRLVRATLFPVGRIAAGTALPETAIVAVVELSFAEGVIAQEVFLGGACAGVPIESATGQSCVGGALAPLRTAPLRDPAAPSRVGTFQEAARRTCRGAGAADSGLYDEDVCVDGGSYWMGDVRRQGFGGHVDGVPEHLVTISPFFLDRYEYTVGRYLRAIAEGFTSEYPPPGASGDCHYGNDTMTAYPLNCVRARFAEELCAFEGRRLPTEAEREWAAGSGTNEFLFPWGDSIETDDGLRTGPGPVGTRIYDVTVLGGIHDMGWNVIEWIADDFQLYTEPCWSPGGYGVDPRCVITPEDVERGRSGRGGYWLAAGDAGRTYYPMVPTRQTFPPNLRWPKVGFRCARDDDAAP